MLGLRPLSGDFRVTYDVARRFFFEKMSKRRSHHGFDHADAVLSWTRKLSGNSFCMELLTLALLHDVNDHKFDDHVAQEEFKKLSVAMLPTLADDPSEFAMFEAAIEAISFSKEKKRGTLWWSDNLDARWLEWRDIVSDADKLEALGINGFHRCFEVSRDFAIKRGDPTDDASLLLDVVKHCHEKLFLLKSKYIRTVHGKVAAEEETQILKDLKTAEVELESMSGDDADKMQEILQQAGKARKYVIQLAAFLG